MCIDSMFSKSRDSVYLVEQKLEHLEFINGESQDYFDKLDGLLNLLEQVGVHESDDEVKHILIRQLPAKYDVERRSTLAQPDGLTLEQVESIVRDAYARHETAKLRKPPAPKSAAQAPPPVPASQNPHALAVGTGDGFRQGTGGGYRQGGGGGGGSGGGSQQQQRQPDGVVYAPQQQPRRPQQFQQQQQTGTPATASVLEWRSRAFAAAAAVSAPPFCT